MIKKPKVFEKTDFEMKTREGKSCYQILLKKLYEMKQELLVNTLTQHIPGQTDKKIINNQKIINKINEIEEIIDSYKK